jgi:formyl-CoA transferase
MAGGHLKLLANPLKLSATPVRYERPPPRFGQDTEAVLRAFGITKDESAD